MIPDHNHFQIGSLIFEDIDQIDVTGPFEVFSRLPNSTYRLYGTTTSPLRDMHGLRLMADALLSDAPQTRPSSCARRPWSRGVNGERSSPGLDTAAGCRSTLHVLGLHGRLDLRSGWTDQRSPRHDSLEFVRPAALLWRNSGK